jgi:hypothetical protein
VIDLTPENLADGIHVSLGANFVLLPQALAVRDGAAIGALACVVLALVKEFWFDMRYETPETSGGVQGGVRDFVGYVAGVTLACVIIMIKEAV